MFVSCECCVLFGYKSLRRVDPSSTGVLPSAYVSLSVIRCNNHPLHIQGVSRRDQTKKKESVTHIAPTLNVHSSAMLLIITLGKFGCA
jgi:hypothetical protein